MVLPEKMTAAILTGHGGLDKIVVRDDLPVPEPEANEVLIKVGACGINNTDINTRIGWYSKRHQPGEEGVADDAGWGGYYWGFDVAYEQVSGDALGQVLLAQHDLGVVHQRATITAHGGATHAFHATGQGDVVPAGGDLGGGQVDGIQARGAVAVEL